MTDTDRIDDIIKEFSFDGLTESDLSDFDGLDGIDLTDLPADISANHEFPALDSPESSAFESGNDDFLHSLTWNEHLSGIGSWDANLEHIGGIVGDNSGHVLPLSINRCAYKLRVHHLPATDGHFTQWRVVVEATVASQLHSIDIDRGMAPSTCFRLHCPALNAQTQLRRLDFATVLVLRRACFAISRLDNGSVTYAYPAIIEVNGYRYTLHHARSSTFWLFAIREQEQQGGAVFDLFSFPQGTALVRVRADGNTDVKDGYMIDPDLSPRNLLAGTVLQAHGDGETYLGVLRPALPTTRLDQEPEYDLRGTLPNRAIAVKRIAHTNDHVAPAVPFRLVDSVATVIGIPIIHHGDAAQLGGELSTADLAQFYTSLFHQGVNENVARGAELMRHAERTVVSDGARGLPIVSLLGVAVCPFSLYVITPYMPIGSLHRYQQRHVSAQLSVSMVQHIAVQLLRVVEPLHACGVAHRAISTETILLEAHDIQEAILNVLSNGQAVLPTDLFLQLHVKLDGLSQAALHRLEMFPRTLDDYQSLLLGPSPIGAHTATCPEHYRALYLQQQPNAPPLMYCGFSVDMWQVGVVLLMILTGCPPFRTSNHPYTAHLPDLHGWMQIVHPPGALRLHPVRDATTHAVMSLVDFLADEACMCFLERLLQPSPGHRLSVPAALQDPWVLAHPSFRAL